MDWTSLGTALGGLVIGIGGMFAKAKIGSAKVDAAANEAESAVITTMRAEFDRMSARLTNLEERCDKQARRIWQLEAELARHGIEVPA